MHQGQCLALFPPLRDRVSQNKTPLASAPHEQQSDRSVPARSQVAHARLLVTMGRRLGTRRLLLCVEESVCLWREVLSQRPLPGPLPLVWCNTEFLLLSFERTVVEFPANTPWSLQSASSPLASFTFFTSSRRAGFEPLPGIQEGFVPK